jgi:uncharacterized cupredoxin-like copper-binding protein
MSKRLLTAVAAMALLVASCAGEKGIETTLDEFSVTLAQTSAPAGPQTFLARNRGSVAHQLLVIRTDRPVDRLPVKDGEVRTKAKGLRVVAEAELISPGSSQTLDVDLSPGTYALICNIAGHYTSGMHARFRAR